MDILPSTSSACSQIDRENDGLWQHVTQQFSCVSKHSHSVVRQKNTCHPARLPHSQGTWVCCPGESAAGVPLPLTAVSGFIGLLSGQWEGPCSLCCRYPWIHRKQETFFSDLFSPTGFLCVPRTELSPYSQPRMLQGPLVCRTRMSTSNRSCMWTASLTWAFTTSQQLQNLLEKLEYHRV